MWVKRSVALLVVLSLLLLSVPLLTCAEDEEPVEEQAPARLNRIAVMETDLGTIRAVLYEDWTPITAGNFINLTLEGHYNGVLFHRIIDDFMIQTGDGGGSSTIPMELHPNATHVDGALGMARSSDPDSASDQFYICDGPQHGLDDASVNPEEGQDPGYAVFGVVIEGIEVVQAIAATPVYGEHRIFMGPINGNMGEPKEDVYLNNVSIEDPNENLTTSIEAKIGSDEPGSSLWIVPFLLIPLVAVAWFYTDKKGLLRKGAHRGAPASAAAVPADPPSAEAANGAAKGDAKG